MSDRHDTASVRVRSIRPSEGRRGPEQYAFCATPNCEQATREGKPYCIEHLGKQPYVRGLLERLERLEAEVARVRRIGPRGVNPSGLVAEEIRREVRVNGPRTVRSLARVLNVDVRVLSSYVAALTQRGFVRQSHGVRGRIFVHDVHGTWFGSVA